MAPTPKRFAPLKRLLDATDAVALSLDQLQALCAQVDLDLYLEDHLFVWLMNELHAREIRLTGTEEDAAAPADGSDDPTQGIQADIEEIVSLQDNEEDRLLNQEETVHLLAAVKEGIAAAEQLAREPEVRHAEALRLLVAKKSEAEATLLTRNQGLVKRISQQYRSSLHSLTMNDLEQEGNLGFLRAISKFDLERTTLLSTYAVYWIRQAIQQAIASQDRAIRLPVHKRNEIRLYRVAVEALRDDLGREPTVREIARKLLQRQSAPRAARPEAAASDQERIERENLHRMQEHVKQLQSYIQQYPTSLDQFMDDDEPDRHEILTDENVLSPEGLVLREDLIGNVDDMVDALPEPERTVMRLRFGFGNQRPLKYAEIAAALNDQAVMVELNDGQAYTSYKVRNLESHARRTLARKKDDVHLTDES